MIKKHSRRTHPQANYNEKSSLIFIVVFSKIKEIKTLKMNFSKFQEIIIAQNGALSNKNFIRCLKFSRFSENYYPLSLIYLNSLYPE